MLWNTHSCAFPLKTQSVLENTLGKVRGIGIVKTMEITFRIWIMLHYVHTLLFPHFGPKGPWRFGQEPEFLEQTSPNWNEIRFFRLVLESF